MLAISADIVTKWLLVELIFLINAVTFRKLIFSLSGFTLNSGWDIHLRPCGIVLHGLQGKEIAATTAIVTA